MKHGQGTDYFANGDAYKGDYCLGKPEGQGTYTWRNGSVYIGTFKEGMKHGLGEWKKDSNSETCNRF